jgi:hypothetical protein
MTILDLKPLLQQYEQMVLEIYALRATLAELPNWDDDTVNQNKEKYRQSVAEKFEVLYRLGDNPAQLNAVLEGILKSGKSN